MARGLNAWTFRNLATETAETPETPYPGVNSGKQEIQKRQQPGIIGECAACWRQCFRECSQCCEVCCDCCCGVCCSIVLGDSSEISAQPEPVVEMKMERS